MTGKQFVDYIRLKTRTNTTTFSDNDILLLANIRLETLSREILGTDEDVLVVPMKTNLVAGLREYPFPQSILSRIKYVEAKLDGTKFIYLTEMDLSKYKRTTDEATILSTFSNEEGHAFYDISRKSLWLYCGVISSVQLGLKLWCNTYPARLDSSRIADTTTDLSVDPTVTSHGFPREFHELWARGVIIDWKQSREKPIPLSETELNYALDVHKAKTDMRNANLDRTFTASVPPASTRGNNGANY